MAFEDRTTANSEAEHVADHNDIHGVASRQPLVNIHDYGGAGLDGATTASLVQQRGEGWRWPGSAISFPGGAAQPAGAVLRVLRTAGG